MHIKPLPLNPAYTQELNRATSTIQFLAPEERSPYRVIWQEGKLMRGGKLYDTSQEKALTQPLSDAFVIAPDSQLYAGAIKVKKFHHSSFLGGGAVLFAGELETDKQGSLIRITNRSGHYKPQKEHLLQALHYFQAAGVDLSKVELQEYSSSQPNALSLYHSAKTYLESEGKCPPNHQRIWGKN